MLNMLEYSKIDNILVHAYSSRLTLEVWNMAVVDANY